MAADDELKSLLDRAAKLVEGLPEALQGEAFNRAFETSRDGSFPEGSDAKLAKHKRPRGGAKPRKAKTSRKRSSPTRLKDLNLRPRGEKSFIDFVGEKQPQTDHERKLVSVYYLERVLELEGVTVDHVYSCVKELNWKVPSNLVNSLQLTATRKAWLDTSDMSSIRVAVPGENYVEQDLPRASKK